MGKLICDSTVASTVIPWRDPTETPSSDPVDQRPIPPPTHEITATTPSWDNVPGLEDQQKIHLTRIYNKGVLWKHPEDKNKNLVFRLLHGGEVEADGNCLFTAARRSMGVEAAARELRIRTVRRFVEDLGSVDEETKGFIQSAIRHMYSPDLKSGWGIHVLQEVKLLAKKQDREALDSAIDELVQLGMQREIAAESIYKERCLAVDDGPSWAKYMSISGSPDDEYDIINMQYTEEGLLTVDENRDGRAAAFGDDIAIECLATEFKREIFVVQAHGSDAMADEENCVFFLPHRPRSEICEPPFFLFMKGTGALATTMAGKENEAPRKKLNEWLLPVTPVEEQEKPRELDANDDKSTVSITVVGASGDLAKKRIFPALFALYYEDCLPKHFTIFGYARSKMTDADLRNMVSKTLTCRIDKRVIDEAGNGILNPQLL